MNRVLGSGLEVMLGSIFGIVYRLAKSLVPGILLHFLWNLFSFHRAGKVESTIKCLIKPELNALNILFEDGIGKSKKEK